MLKKLIFAVAISASVNSTFASSILDLGNDKFVDGNTMHFSGFFHAGDEITFEELLTSNVDTVNFESHGGDLKVGLAIGELIAKNQLKVKVENESVCASSCAIAALHSNFIEGPLDFHRSTSTHPSIELIRNMELSKFYRSNSLTQDEVFFIFHYTNSEVYLRKWFDGEVEKEEYTGNEWDVSYDYN